MQYSASPRRRQHSPTSASNHLDYRPCLRLDFEYTCAYCLAPEHLVAGGDRYGRFEVDHFKPKSEFPHLALLYTNLLWTCHVCNNTKGPHWPPTRLRKQGKRWVDPSREGLGKHLEIVEDHVEALAATGQWLVRRLRLNSAVHRHRRRTWREGLYRLHTLRRLVQAGRVDDSTREEIDAEITKLERQLLDPPWDAETQCRCDTQRPSAPTKSVRRAPAEDKPRPVKAPSARAVIEALVAYHRGEEPRNEPARKHRRPKRKTGKSKT